ncbi:hypothetical protein GCM10010417_21860 [Streptomyces carpaticus]
MSRTARPSVVVGAVAAGMSAVFSAPPAAAADGTDGTDDADDAAGLDGGAGSDGMDGRAPKGPLRADSIGESLGVGGTNPQVRGHSSGFCGRR